MYTIDNIIREYDIKLLWRQYWNTLMSRHYDWNCLKIVSLYFRLKIVEFFNIKKKKKQMLKNNSGSEMQKKKYSYWLSIYIFHVELE